jgi:hypothetical protein
MRARPDSNRVLLRASVGLAAAILCAPAALGADDKLTLEDVISGVMEIQFNTRTQLDENGQPAKGVQDEYKLTLNVAKTTEFNGAIRRQPRLIRKVVGTEVQPAQLVYDVGLWVLNPTDLTQKRSVGKWVGSVPVDVNGNYALGGSKDSPLRIVVDAVGKAQAFRENFGGKLVGKPKEKRGGAMSFIRRVAGKEVKIEVKNSDPMRFDSLVLAAGPAASYPRTVVNGNLDYDYETGNWYTNGIRFRYTLDGADREDVVTGSIKWVEDPNRDQNGKGRYEFNLRFNEEKNSKSSSESDAFKTLSDEEAFFAVDLSIPSLTGTVEYDDTMMPDRGVPGSSKIRYGLDAHNLTKQQVVNFFKLWIVCIGPTNDE